MSKKEQEIKLQLSFAALFIAVAVFLGSLLSKILSSDYFGNLVGEPSNMALILGAAIGVGGAVFAVQYAHTLNKRAELRDFATYLLAEMVLAEFHMTVVPKKVAEMIKKARGDKGATAFEAISQSLGYLQDGGIFEQFNQVHMDPAKLGRLPFAVITRFVAIRITMAQLSDTCNMLKNQLPVTEENGQSDSIERLKEKMAVNANLLVKNALYQITAIVNALAEFANLSEADLDSFRVRAETYSRQADA